MLCCGCRYHNYGSWLRFLGRDWQSKDGSLLSSHEFRAFNEGVRARECHSTEHSDFEHPHLKSESNVHSAEGRGLHGLIP